MDPHSSYILRDTIEPKFLTERLYQAAGGLVLLMSLLIISIGTTTTALGQSAEIVLATVNGKDITQKDVDDSIAARVVPLQQQLYALRKVALENLITKRLLEDEASRRNTTIEELRRRLMEGPLQVTGAQVEALYQQNAPFFALMSPDEAKERLRLDLESQARMKHFRAGLERLRNASTLIVNLSPPVSTPAFEEAGSPALGAHDSSVTIVEFSDFECPFCKTVQPALKQVLQQYSSSVKLVFKNFPLENHRHSVAAARAGYCASQQDRFWQYHDALFATRDISADSFVKIATDLGLEMEKFQACINSPDSINAVTRDVEAGRRLQVDSTPTFIINGKAIKGAISLTDFKRIIDQELQRSPLKASSLR